MATFRDVVTGQVVTAVNADHLAYLEEWARWERQPDPVDEPAPVEPEPAQPDPAEPVPDKPARTAQKRTAAKTDK